MPIYAYKCGSCGHAKDVLQKMSDQPLPVCPACGAEAFSKQLTAAGFQLSARPFRQSNPHLLEQVTMREPGELVPHRKLVWAPIDLVDHLGFASICLRNTPLDSIQTEHALAAALDVAPEHIPAARQLTNAPRQDPAFGALTVRRAVIERDRIFAQSCKDERLGRVRRARQLSARTSAPARR